MKNILMPLIFGLALCATAWAENLNSRELGLKGVERLKDVKARLKGVDGKTLQETIKDLEKTKYPLLHLRMREAMAKTYGEIAEEHKITDRKRKEWLYSMVVLNMAYLQFDGGGKGDAQTEPLNQLIRRKLIKELTPEVLNHPGFHYSID